MSKKVKKKVPELRFSGFEGNWETDRIDNFLVRHVDPVKVQLEMEYKQIGIRSHGKGIFHKDAVTGEELGNKRVFWVHAKAFVVNIVFAWEQAVALTSSDEKGFIASHRFLMFLPEKEKSSLEFVLLFFLRQRGKYLLELASPGGAGRNKTLGQQNFAELEITLPQKAEQEKIASFLGTIDTRLTQLRRKRELLQTYKRGVMQKIFSQQIRFRGAIGLGFPDWREETLGDFLQEYKGRVSTDTELPIYSSSREGLKPQKEYFSDRELMNEGEYGIVPNGFFVYRHMSDDLTFKFNVNETGKSIAVSKEYPVFTAKNLNTNFLLHKLNYSDDFKSFAITQKRGGTRTRLYYKNLSAWKTLLPSLKEQEKIVDFLTTIDRKIEAISRQIDRTEQFKKGLLQKMFV